MSLSVPRIIMGNASTTLVAMDVKDRIARKARKHGRNVVEDNDMPLMESVHTDKIAQSTECACKLEGCDSSHRHFIGKGTVSTYKRIMGPMDPHSLLRPVNDASDCEDDNAINAGMVALGMVDEENTNHYGVDSDSESYSDLDDPNSETCKRMGAVTEYSMAMRDWATKFAAEKVDEAAANGLVYGSNVTRDNVVDAHADMLVRIMAVTLADSPWVLTEFIAYVVDNANVEPVKTPTLQDDDNGENDLDEQLNV